MTDTIIDFIRHGAPEGGRRYRGRIDDPLSEHGWEQMWDAVKSPADWELILSSPLVRCSDFAHTLADKLELDCIEDERLTEVSYGGWEGMSGEDLKKADPDVLARFYHNPSIHRPDDAERLEDFQARVSDVFEDIRETYRDRQVLVVTHAGVIRAVIAHVVSAPVDSLYRITVPTASLARVRCNAERPPTLVFHGRQHL